MIVSFPNSPREPIPQRPVPLDLVIAQHGAGKVLRAALVALIRRRQHAPPVLSEHLRRDMGLPYEPPPPPPPNYPLLR
ncbi:hypothetical protein [Acidimangrovimonas sediminis]|uniref:hypothetical protein n=1 Tax=Acidimangrovimonas sediminis TaxID=2056283 RepID=UPI000C8035E4|nr:hypothetical protein [Acidimangrovimonas sediminis]